MPQTKDVRAQLLNLPRVPLERHTIYFKTAPGTYGAHDRFLGITVPNLRKLCKTCPPLSFNEIQGFITSPYNEERLFALFVLIDLFEKGEGATRTQVYDFYLQHKSFVNNWNLVDASAHKILGAHLWDLQSLDILKTLVPSPSLWDRRIAIVALWFFIKKGEVGPTLELSARLLQDPEDLMHKAVGWMLREVGKQDLKALHDFLTQHKTHMPRVMLRYAIERFSKEERQGYMRG